MMTAYTGVMNSLLGKLTTLMGEEFAKIKNVRNEVKFIRDELTGMKDALEGLSDLDELDTQTKRWRDIVREMSYDIEEIIDDFMQNIGNTNRNIGFVTKMVQRLKTLMARHRVAGQIEEVKKLVLETSARRKRYKLDIPLLSNVVAIDPRVKTLYQKVVNLVGMEEPKNKLVNWIIDGAKELKVVSVVGFGGLGKTTLANLVYGKLKVKFERCAFVPVSQKPDITKLLRSLLLQLGGMAPSRDCELNVLLDELREYLQDKRYLIVIDDIWDIEAWSFIKCAFPENDLGSRVIATTRIQDVAKACCSDGLAHVLNMMPLNDEDSRRLFFDRIFDSEKACPDHLRNVSSEILKKCGGLPLAIVSISSMLASEGSVQQERWKHVRDSLGSGMNLTLEGVRKILNLSYKDLPCHLKTCLLFLGMYPEDYTILRSDLERQWMAESFVNKENGQDVEKVASNYFNDLVNRSLIQPVEFDKHGSVTKCKVHDMMLDLILLKSAQENFLTILDGPQALTGLAYKIRRLSIRLDGERNGRTILPRNINMSQVRSVMFFGSSKDTPPLSEFKVLRVIFIDLGRAIVDLTGLCKLYQLKYLWIGKHCSYQLPIQIGVLEHLETLVLPSCDSLPSDIVGLPRLIHLDVETGLPDGVDKMKSLRHLCTFHLEKNSLDNIKGLGELTNLRYLILKCNGRLDNRGRRLDVLRSSLGNLCSLEDLLVYLPGCIDGLMPLFTSPTPYRLERLVLLPDGWVTRVPSWMGQLRHLCELECEIGELLTDGVGVLADLPLLSVLELQILNATTGMIVICGKAFPALKRLKLQLSSASYLTFQVGAMPKLQRLQLNFNARGSEQNGFAPTGIHHLLALEEFSAGIGCVGTQKSDVEAAFSSALTMHPSHPRVGIDFLGYYDFYMVKTSS